MLFGVTWDQWVKNKSFPLIIQYHICYWCLRLTLLFISYTHCVIPSDLGKIKWYKTTTKYKKRELHVCIFCGIYRTSDSDLFPLVNKVRPNAENWSMTIFRINPSHRWTEHVISLHYSSPLMGGRLEFIHIKGPCGMDTIKISITHQDPRNIRQ